MSGSGACLQTFCFLTCVLRPADTIIRHSLNCAIAVLCLPNVPTRHRTNHGISLPCSNGHEFGPAVVAALSTDLPNVCRLDLSHVKCPCQRAALDPTVLACDLPDDEGSGDINHAWWGEPGRPVPLLTQLTSLVLSGCVGGGDMPDRTRAASPPPRLLPLALLAPRLARLEVSGQFNCARWVIGHLNITELSLGFTAMGLFCTEWDREPLDTPGDWMEIASSLEALEALECGFGPDVSEWRRSASSKGWQSKLRHDARRGFEDWARGAGGPPSSRAWGANKVTPAWPRLSRLAVDVSRVGISLTKELLACHVLGSASGVRRLDVTCAPPDNVSKTSRRLAALRSLPGLEFVNVTIASEERMTDESLKRLLLATPIEDEEDGVSSCGAAVKGGARLLLTLPSAALADGAVTRAACNALCAVDQRLTVCFT